MVQTSDFRHKCEVRQEVQPSLPLLLPPLLLPGEGVMEGVDRQSLSCPVCVEVVGREEGDLSRGGRRSKRGRSSPVVVDDPFSPVTKL